MTAMTPWFIATEQFTPLHKAWHGYIEWSGLKQLTELVSLDPILCPPVLSELKPQYWPHIVNEDFMLNFFLDFTFLQNEISEIKDKNVLCVFRNPTEPPGPPAIAPFEFLGYDLVDIQNSECPFKLRRLSGSVFEFRVIVRRLADRFQSRFKNPGTAAYDISPRGSCKLSLMGDIPSREIVKLQPATEDLPQVLDEHVLGGFDTSGLHAMRMFRFEWTHFKVSEDTVIGRPEHPLDVRGELWMLVVIAVI